MPLPDPEPGLVIRYDYLWSREAFSGRDTGKDRPACIVVAAEPSAEPRFVILVAITHSAPVGNTAAVEIPDAVCRQLKLDHARNWVIVSEYNVDDWPSAGIRELPGKPGQFAYGSMPPRFFVAIKRALIGGIESGSSRSVRR